MYRPSIRRTTVAAVAVLLILGAAIGTTQVQTPELPPRPVSPPERRGGERVFLTYQEQSISDVDMAKVVALIANAVDPGEWPEQTLKDGETIEGLIDRVYDYYPSGQYSRPRTVAAIRSAIVGVNADGEVKALRIPPIPVRGHGDYRKGPSIRSYETEQQAYVLNQQATNVDIGVSPLMADARRMERQRSATTTMVVLPVTAALTGFMRQTTAAVPGAVAILSAVPNSLQPDKRRAGYAQVEFMAGAEQPCEDAALWLNQSPYKDEVLQRVRALTPEELQTLADRARRAPLMIIDHDFSGLGHGSKVRSVVRYTLRSLGVLDPLAPAIQTFDLAGTSQDARERLRATLDEYLASDDAPSNIPQADDARRWIREESELAALPGYDVPDLLIQAVFWKYLRQQGWVNMSFRVRSPALLLLQHSFVADLKSFAVVAAGNDQGELDPEWLPQQAAVDYPNFVNVTFGTRAGAVRGRRSSTTFGSIVSLLAPGCGFESETVRLSDAGTSLSSPYVAASAWLKYLIDDVDARTMRRALLASTRPVPRNAIGIEAGGVFDAAKLLVAPKPHLLDKDGRVVLLNNVRLEVTCTAGDETITASYTPQDALVRAFVVEEQGGQFFLWRRQLAVDGFPKPSFLTNCAISSLVLHADGQVKHRNVTEYAAAVRELSM